MSDKTGPRGGNRYKCNGCGGDEFKNTELHIDHIETVIELNKTYHEYTLDELCLRIFGMTEWDGPINWGNFQTLCKECHDKKTNLEKAERASNKRKKKDEMQKLQRKPNKKRAKK
jgi:5-methylcytosine-specific restriction endonuclease McrA